MVLGSRCRKPKVSEIQSSGGGADWPAWLKSDVKGTKRISAGEASD